MDTILKHKMLRDMMRIRCFESKLESLSKAKEIYGFLHLYIGQEAIAVGVCCALNSDDYITSNHRGHGHMIAKGVSTRSMMAELFAKAGGCNGGKGGSMHICVPDLGVIGTNGIVGGGFPLATGAAFTARYTGNGRVSVCFFGDGSTSEGSFHESVNMAAIWKLPVVFVCENNQYACNTPFIYASSVPTVVDRARVYKIATETVDGNDVEKVHEAMTRACEYARAGNGPVLLECNTFRWFPHSIGYRDFRTTEEIENWKKQDPITTYAKRLLTEGLISQGEIDGLWFEAENEIIDAVEYARNADEPKLQCLIENVYAQ